MATAVCQDSLAEGDRLFWLTDSSPGDVSRSASCPSGREFSTSPLCAPRVDPTGRPRRQAADQASRVCYNGRLNSPQAHLDWLCARATRGGFERNDIPTRTRGHAISCHGGAGGGPASGARGRPRDPHGGRRAGLRHAQPAWSRRAWRRCAAARRTTRTAWACTNCVWRSAEHYRRATARRVVPEQIIVTQGTSPALYLVFAALLEPGDEVILCQPLLCLLPQLHSLRRRRAGLRRHE